MVKSSPVLPMRIGTDEPETAKTEKFFDANCVVILLWETVEESFARESRRRGSEPKFKLEETMYQFALLDPRPIDAAKATNERVFNLGPVLGIEVTVPALATQCVLGNIDPQHTGGNASRAAIEDSVVVELPPQGAVLATVRPDLDSFGSMAILAMRAEGVEVSSNMLERVGKIAKSDTFSRGGWPGVQPLPTPENPWPEGGSELAAIAAAVFDHKVAPAERVSIMRRWLELGVEPAEYRARMEAERQDLVQAIAEGRIATSIRANGKVAVVESSHRGALMIGYSQAPVVVALNPELRFQGGEPHRKFTLCQYEAGHVDLRAALAELTELEQGWGGSPTIIGSLQGVSSTLSVEQVAEVIERHLA